MPPNENVFGSFYYDLEFKDERATFYKKLDFYDLNIMLQSINQYFVYGSFIF